jgi:hypothetical protein
LDCNIEVSAGSVVHTNNPNAPDMPKAASIARRRL